MRRARISRTRLRMRFGERPSRAAISAIATPRLRRLTIRASRSALFRRAVLRAATDRWRRAGDAGRFASALGFELFVMGTNIEHFPQPGKTMLDFQKPDPSRPDDKRNRSGTLPTQFNRGPPVSFPRKRESRASVRPCWMAAFADMTGRGGFASTGATRHCASHAKLPSPLGSSTSSSNSAIVCSTVR